ncbi:hypothetical protein ATANTOWER_010214, partial [Ataeniobius toweri]|nr:hypothetical protein [Ataeniobius toweri]
MDQRGERTAKLQRGRETQKHHPGTAPNRQLNLVRCRCRTEEASGNSSRPVSMATEELYE